MKDGFIRVTFALEDDLSSLVRPPSSRLERAVERTASVKDAIERLGIPHTEVLAIAVNGRFVDFSRGVAEGDELRVFSHASSVPVTARLGPSSEGWEPRFVLDVHLGTLARRLRLLGFDSVYDRHLHDPELARLARVGDRALLTRDRGLLKRNEVTRGHLVRSTAPHAQLEEVLERFDLRARFAPFTRCIRCNSPIEKAPKALVAHRLAPGVLRDFDELFRCSGCGQPYWRGSHYDRLLELVDGLGRAG